MPALVQSMGGVGQPGIDMLAHGGQHQAKEPAIPASGLGLEQVEVVLFTFDGAFGAGAGIAVTVPEVTVSRDEGMEAIVFLGIGVDDPPIGRTGTAIVEERASSQLWGLFGGSEGTTPFDAEAVGTEAPVGHGLVGQANRHAAFEP